MVSVGEIVVIIFGISLAIGLWLWPLIPALMWVYGKITFEAAAIIILASISSIYMGNRISDAIGDRL
jgi:hypothetical protein